MKQKSTQTFYWPKALSISAALAAIIGNDAKQRRRIASKLTRQYLKGRLVFTGGTYKKAPGK